MKNEKSAKMIRRALALLFAAFLPGVLLVCQNPAALGTPATAPSAPSISSVVSGDTNVTVTSSSVADATSYNLYYATGSTVTTTTGSKITGVSSPRIVAPLVNGTQYAFIVTAVNGSGESAPSALVTATPGLPSPVISSLVIGSNQAIVSWSAVSGATSYNLYYAIGNSVTTATGLKLTGVPSGVVVGSLLTATTQYAFIVTAVNSFGESAPSGIVCDYPEIVIDTFHPTGFGFVFKFLVIDLFDSSGVQISQDPWSSPGINALAVDGNSISGFGSNPSPHQTGFAYIDYKPAVLPVSGTVLYVRIRLYSNLTSTPGPYAVRILTAASDPLIDTYPYYGSTNPADSPYESDDNPTFGGVPTNPVLLALGGSLNRSIGSLGDVDWLKITLP